jgi:hypothetical protein
VGIETARSAPSKPRPKPKPKRKRARAGSESEGESSSGDSSSDDEDGDKGKDLLHTFFEGGDELHKATGHGVDDGCERVLFYEINGVGRRSVLLLRLQKCVAGCRSTKLGKQGALISRPVKHCATQPWRLLYFIRKFCRAVQQHLCLHYSALCALCLCVHYNYRRLPCFIRVLRAASRRTPLSCPVLLRFSQTACRDFDRLFFRYNSVKPLTMR